jgi:hypothetical protein
MYRGWGGGWQGEGRGVVAMVWTDRAREVLALAVTGDAAGVDVARPLGN